MSIKNKENKKVITSKVYHLFPIIGPLLPPDMVQYSSEVSNLLKQYDKATNKEKIEKELRLIMPLPYSCNVWVYGIIANENNLQDWVSLTLRHHSENPEISSLTIIVKIIKNNPKFILNYFSKLCYREEICQ